MEGAAILFLFIPLLFGAMVLMLAMGYRSIEQQRAEGEQEATGADRDFLRIPRFFARPGEWDRVGAAGEPTDGLLRLIRHYMEQEHEAVDAFISRPSIHTLHRGTSGRRLAS